MFSSRVTIGATSALLLVSLAGCSWLGLGGSGEPAQKPGYAVADEPLAAQAGASTLAQGGSAADAVTAMYFTLAATYPVAAGLGGGGLCLVRGSGSSRTQEINFLARDSANAGAYGVPGNVRGFGVVQSAFGRLPWQRDVAPGEGYASAGFPISVALEARLLAAQNAIRLDASLAAEFLNESGQVKPAGAQVSDPDLGATLSAIRLFGPNVFYRGAIADKLVAYSSGQGGAFSTGELAAYPVGRIAPATVDVADETLYVPSREVGAGVFSQTLLAHVVNGQGQIVAGANPASAVAEATRDTLQAFGIRSLPKDLGATGFAAVDGTGQAVACAVTLNGAFGSGHTAGNTGVILARSPSSEDTGFSAAFLSPMIATGDNSLVLAGAGAGGPNGTAALVDAVIRLAQNQDILQPGHMHSTGLAPFDTVNVIACENDACAAVPDPAAHGLGATTP